MNTVLNVKLDPVLKRQAQEAAKALGLPISTVVAAGLREFVRTRSITISDPPQLKPEVEAELLKLSADAKKGINISPVFDNLAESFAWLDREVANECKVIKKTA
jgi:antitoxin component of RelBE/YafQ-DinJ toxin-antitoxin module